jgi:four helix bundle protein
MATVRNFRELIVWQRAMELVKDVYHAVAQFPSQERYCLSDQLRRSAVSIPSNIAEGQARQHTAEFRHFLHVELGSLAELETQMIIANDVGYVGPDVLRQAEAKIDEIRRMIFGLLQKLPK